MEVVPENPSYISGSRVQHRAKSLERKTDGLESGGRFLKLPYSNLLNSPLSTLSSLLYALCSLVLFRHGSGDINHCQYHEDKGLEETGENR